MRPVDVRGRGRMVRQYTRSMSEPVRPTVRRVDKIASASFVMQLGVDQTSDRPFHTGLTDLHVLGRWLSTTP